MKKCLLFLCLVFSLVAPVLAQSYFEDGLSADFHSGRRQALRAQMPANSVAVIFTNSQKNRSNDVDFIYHPNTDFYYLTGFREPNAALVIFSERRDFGSFSTDEILYVQNRDPQAEMWNGKRLGIEGVKEKLGFEQVFLNDTFGKTPALELGKFDKILSFDLANDIEDSRANTPLAAMQAKFKTESGYSEGLSVNTQQLYELIRTTPIENSANVAQVIGRNRRFYPEVENDPILNDFVNADSPEKRQEIKAKLPDSKLNIIALEQIMNSLREIKSEEEVALLSKAAQISAIGQVEVMKAAQEGMSEREIQGIHEFIYKRYGAENVGYPSIVGAGNNGCILHYIENDLKNVNERLLLMDLGAEWRGYTADVTRSIPISGKFNSEEKAIYELVLKSQEAGIKLCQAGTEFSEIGRVTRQIINDGLTELGVIKEGENHNYFPHGTSHHLGLDVHDRGGYGPLREGMVLTVEPGIYIPEGSDCDPKWWGIAVRIEDDILVSANGPVNLSADAPRTVADIEALMLQSSPLENWTLPGIK
ncbi:aminopeptidase P N-terminal domain-containing protein [Algoriphagus aestuariicola]|uniref:Xaa-Pro aminopeptidase n=1 Tax=Algoriphagus aestuariicola TaxID=1852016 RepID=A0ABS3BZ41_9BACT|nr:aminopeptidase P N-terminal domain-containing protein [Algoriphagus aestuariicola]MBN7803625.1 aminopeptidase P N-terminal domain-containing protein [Algoriphagus aestuariicola]